jgi:hypothetical protein
LDYYTFYIYKKRPLRGPFNFDNKKGSRNIFINTPKSLGIVTSIPGLHSP